MYVMPLNIKKYHNMCIANIYQLHLFIHMFVYKH